MLALAGVVAVLALVGGRALPLAAFWLLFCAAIGWVWVTSGRLIRTGLAIALVPACVLMTFEGGLFFLPAAFALIASTLTPKRYPQRSSPR